MWPEVCLIMQASLTILTLTISTIVLVCFQKGGGKNGRHGWVHSTPKVHSLSNIGVQLFEHAHVQIFRAVHDANARLQTRRFELIQACQLLTTLQTTPCLSIPTGADIKISGEDLTVYRLLKERTSHIEQALKYINSRKTVECIDIDSEAVGQK